MRFPALRVEIGVLVASLVLGSASALDVTRPAQPALSRRAFLAAAGVGACSTAQPAAARRPGSEDVSEAIEQIVMATAELKRLQGTWATYACIDNEGRACNIDAARKILGGVAPQRGDAAIAVAKETPLYRIDGAFKAVRKYALNAGDGSWAETLDVTAFVEKGEDINLSLKKHNIAPWEQRSQQGIDRHWIQYCSTF